MTIAIGGDGDGDGARGLSLSVHSDNCICSIQEITFNQPIKTQNECLEALFVGYSTYISTARRTNDGAGDGGGGEKF